MSSSNHEASCVDALYRQIRLIGFDIPIVTDGTKSTVARELFDKLRSAEPGPEPLEDHCSSQ